MIIKKRFLILFLILGIFFFTDSIQDEMDLNQNQFFIRNVNAEEPEFLQDTISDNNGNDWTSYYIKRTDLDDKCHFSPTDSCYVNISKISTPYGVGVALDTIGSTDGGHHFFAYSNTMTSPESGKIKISGKFLKNDDFYSLDQEVGRSIESIYILSEDANTILSEHRILTWEDANDIWHDKEIIIDINPNQNYKVGIGRIDNWTHTDWKLYQAWTGVEITEIQVSSDTATILQTPPNVADKNEFNFDIPPPQTIPEPKLETQIFEIQMAPDKEKYAKQNGLTYKDGKIKVILDLQDSDSKETEEIKLLSDADFFVGNQIQANIEVNKISEIKNILQVKKIRSPTTPLQNEIISEGLPFISADVVQQTSEGGSNVKIAILDLAFDESNPEIDVNIIEAKSFRNDFDNLKIPIKGYGNQFVHGTAVAEIIIDIVPNAQIYLYTIGTEMEFSQAMDYSAKKVDLIAMSAGWINYPSDGSSPMTKKIEEKIRGGTPVVISAGNYAQTHWEGEFIDSNSNGWHEFSNDDEGTSINVSQNRIQNKIPIILYMMWDNPNGPTSDYNLILSNEEGERVAYSGNQQEDNERGYEYISFVPEDAGVYFVGISGKESTEQEFLEIFSPTDVLEYSTPDGSVGVPTDANGVVVVGALNQKDLSIQPYSSQGPTNHGNIVPTVMAPDGITTQAYKGQLFFGTSAAAPHVAGIVALLLEKQPDLTPDNILKQLQENADKKAVGLKTDHSNLYGYGKVDGAFISENIVQSTKNEISIPNWVKNNAGWWAERLISDEDFASGIQFMIKEGIIQVPTAPGQTDITQDVEIPDWIRNNADWWSQDLISDKDFASGIQYLVTVGIISV